MNTKTKKRVRVVIITLIFSIVIGGGIVIYLLNMPHRDVQAASVDYSLNVSEIVKEYLDNPAQANSKYLDEEGESKILQITGVIAEISEDFNGQKVVLLKADGIEAGVSATFIPEFKTSKEIKTGDQLVVKGVIQSGAAYDEDLEMYENVIMDKCDIVSK